MSGHFVGLLVTGASLERYYKNHNSLAGMSNALGVNDALM